MLSIPSDQIDELETQCPRCVADGYDTAVSVKETFYLRMCGWLKELFDGRMDDGPAFWVCCNVAANGETCKMLNLQRGMFCSDCNRLRTDFSTVAVTRTEELAEEKNDIRHHERALQWATQMVANFDGSLNNSTQARLQDMLDAYQDLIDTANRDLGVRSHSGFLEMMKEQLITEFQPLLDDCVRQFLAEPEPVRHALVAVPSAAPELDFDGVSEVAVVCSNPRPTSLENHEKLLQHALESITSDLDFLKSVEFVEHMLHLTEEYGVLIEKAKCQAIVEPHFVHILENQKNLITSCLDENRGCTAQFSIEDDDSDSSRVDSENDFVIGAAGVFPDVDVWACPLCTYINTGEALNCEMCETDRVLAFICTNPIVAKPTPSPTPLFEGEDVAVDLSLQQFQELSTEEDADEDVAIALSLLQLQDSDLDGRANLRGCVPELEADDIQDETETVYADDDTEDFRDLLNRTDHGITNSRFRVYIADGNTCALTAALPCLPRHLVTTGSHCWTDEDITAHCVQSVESSAGIDCTGLVVRAAPDDSTESDETATAARVDCSSLDIQIDQPDLINAVGTTEIEHSSTEDSPGSYDRCEDDSEDDSEADERSIASWDSVVLVDGVEDGGDDDWEQV
jgi:hypothetical protein